MNCVERIKTICKEQKVPISKLERDLGFANGYIGQLRKGVLPYDRLVQVAEYLSVTTDYLMTGEDKKIAPTADGERIDMNEVDIAFYGNYKELSDDDQKTIRDMVRVMRERRANREKSEGRKI